MDGFNTPFIYFCLANFLFVSTCLICALLKWFHICREYRGNVDYFFPARKVVTFMFATQILQSLYWLDVFSDTIFFYAAVFGVVVIPPFFVMMESRFFFFKPIYAIEVAKHFLLPFLILFFILFCIFNPSINLEPCMIYIKIIATALILIELSLIVKSKIKVLRIIRNRFEQELSDLDSFPRVFARSTIGSTIFVSLLLLSVLWFESRGLKLFVDLLLTLMSLQLLVLTLDAKRKLPSALLANEHDMLDENGQADKSESLTDQKRKYLEICIIELLEKDELFKDSKLSLMMLSKRLGKNRSYISETIKHSEYNSFYKMVNHFRIEYAKQQLIEKPFITIESLAFDAGFSSRFTFARLFKENTGISPSEWRAKYQKHTS